MSSEHVWEMVCYRLLNGRTKLEEMEQQGGSQSHCNLKIQRKENALRKGEYTMQNPSESLVRSFAHYTSKNFSSFLTKPAYRFMEIHVN